MEDRNRKARSLYTTYTKRNRCKCGKPRLKGRCRCRECYRRLGLSKEVPPLLVQIMAHLDGAALKVMGASEKLQHINAIHGGDKFQALSLLTDELSKEISRVSKAIMEMPELNDGKL